MPNAAVSAPRAKSSALVWRHQTCFAVHFLVLPLDGVCWAIDGDGNAGRLEFSDSGKDKKVFIGAQTGSTKHHVFGVALDLPSPNSLTSGLFSVGPMEGGLVMESTFPYTPSGGNISIDSKMSIMFIAGALYDFSSGDQISSPRGDEGLFDFADFHDEYGFLISKKGWDGDDLLLFNPSRDVWDGIRVSGSKAFWGWDDWIYFFRRQETELWRCRPDGSNQQRIYVSERKAQIWRQPQARSFAISPDGRLLAVKGTEGYR